MKSLMDKNKEEIMGIKLLWCGLILNVAGSFFDTNIPSVRVVGAVIMVIGCILMLLDK